MAVEVYDVANELCQALGLDSTRVRSVTVSFNAGETVLATVVMMPSIDQVKKMIKLSGGSDVDVTTLGERTMRMAC